MTRRRTKPVQPVSSGNETDCFHVLQAPKPVSPDDPFVGNETVDDNLAESAQVAVWKATDGSCDGLAVSVAQGCVTLSGAVETAEHAQHCETAVRAVPGVLHVINSLAWKDPQADGAGTPA